MHYTTRLIFLAALCGLTAHAQIIKSNVFTRKDLTSAANKATARALLGISEWVTNSVPSYTNSVPSYTNIVADLTALTNYAGASTLVLVTDALRGGAFRYEATGYTADGGVVIDATTGKGSGAWVRQCDPNAVYARWWAADRTDLGAALRSARDYIMPLGGGTIYIDGDWTWGATADGEAYTTAVALGTVASGTNASNQLNIVGVGKPSVSRAATGTYTINCLMGRSLLTNSTPAINVRIDGIAFDAGGSLGAGMTNGVLLSAQSNYETNRGSFYVANCTFENMGLNSISASVTGINTIDNCTFSGQMWGNYGGQIYVGDADANVSIKNCTFDQLTYRDTGLSGAAYAGYTKALYANVYNSCVVQNCYFYGAGGLNLRHSHALVSNNTFVGMGGASALDRGIFNVTITRADATTVSDVSIVNNLFIESQAAWDVQLSSTVGTIERVLIANNNSRNTHGTAKMFINVYEGNVDNVKVRDNTVSGCTYFISAYRATADPDQWSVENNYVTGSTYLYWIQSGWAQRFVDRNNVYETPAGAFIYNGAKAATDAAILCEWSPASDSVPPAAYRSGVKGALMVDTNTATAYIATAAGTENWEPIDTGWRSPVTAKRTSLAATTKIVDESGGAIGNFDTGWTVGASWTTNSSAVVNATGATNSLSHTTVTPLVGPPRFVTMTLVSGGTWTIDADASLTVTIGGNVMRTFTNADPPSGTMTISGMVDGTTDEVVFTVYAPDAKTVSGSFDNFKIVVLAAGDFLHRHAYPAAALVKATSATAPAPYFEFSAAGTHAANGNAKDKVIALVNTTVTNAPAILATIPSTDNNGSWRLKGKVYAAYGSGGTDYDNFMLELDYVDGSGTYTTSLHSTDLTGDVFAWNAAGYFLIGANADTADGDVTINTSSVEYKP